MTQGVKQSLAVSHRTVNILSLRRILRALVYSVGFGFAVTVAAAIALGLINIYLTGHGNTLFQEDVFDGPILYGGYDDLILIGLSSSTIVISFIVFYRSKTH
jgi:hypothetical protein